LSDEGTYKYHFLLSANRSHILLLSSTSLQHQFIVTHFAESCLARTAFSILPLISNGRHDPQRNVTPTTSNPYKQSRSHHWRLTRTRGGIRPSTSQATPSPSSCPSPKTGPAASAAQVDLRSLDAPAGIVQHLMQNYGEISLSILVNNTGYEANQPPQKLQLKRSPPSTTSTSAHPCY
jgi:hypothetical protein